ncbi:MAG: hypothetical protein ABL932_07575, partial [Terricaulis sp.]
LGSHYKPSSDGGAGDIRASCLAGEVLALRELGRFREMGDALRRLRAEPARPAHLLAPLEAEAANMASQAPFPSDWRKSFAHQVVQGGGSAPQQNSGGAGCMVPIAVFLAGAGTSWWYLLNT